MHDDFNDWRLQAVGVRSLVKHVLIRSQQALVHTQSLGVCQGKGWFGLPSFPLLLPSILAAQTKSSFSSPFSTTIFVSCSLLEHWAQFCRAGIGCTATCLSTTRSTRTWQLPRAGRSFWRCVRSGVFTIDAGRPTVLARLP